MTLKTALKNRKIAELRKITKESTIADIADMLEELTFAERALYFRLLKTKQQSIIFAALEPEYQEKLVKAFTDKEIEEIVAAVYSDDLADLIEDVPEELAQKILRNVDKETRADVNKILRYDDDQTGSVMTVDIIALKQTISVGQAIKEVKTLKEEAEISHHIYVVDSKNKLQGRISLEDLLFNSKSAKLKSIMKPTSYVYTTTDREDAAREFAIQDRSSLPVLNKNKELVGVITHDDVLDIIHEEATEDIHRMAGIESHPDEAYSKMSIRKIFKSRIFWLMLLMISATLSQIVLDAFQGIASNKLDGTTVGVSSAIWTTAIVAILPVISGAAGNAGSQSSTTVIRALAMDDITPKDYVKVFRKELGVANLMGLALGVANFVRLVIYYSATGDIGGDKTHDFLFLAMAASIALYAVIVLAKVAGGMLPLLAKKMHLDPAVMAAPLLTTLIDALSTMIFFGISIGIMIAVM